MKTHIRKYPKGFGKRRVDIEIENFDTWNLDNTLALIILPALLQLKYTKQGIPSEFVEYVGGDMDRNHCFDFIKEDNNQVFDLACKKWDEVLDKIIWSFQQLAIEEYDDKYHHGKMDIGWEKIPDKLFSNPLSGKTEPLYHMVDKNPNEHWYDHVGHRLHEDRIQEGLDLFGRYFRNLWD